MSTTVDMDMFGEETSQVDKEAPKAEKKEAPPVTKKRKVREGVIDKVKKTKARKTEVEKKPSKPQVEKKPSKPKVEKKPALSEVEKKERKKKRDISVIQSHRSGERYKRALLRALEKEYSDSSVLEIMDKFNEHDEDEASNARGIKNMTANKGSFFFALADSGHHLDKAGVMRSEKNVKPYVGRLKEQLVFSITQRSLLALGTQKNKKTISERDVNFAIKSAGLVSV